MFEPVTSTLIVPRSSRGSDCASAGSQTDASAAEHPMASVFALRQDGRLTCIARFREIPALALHLPEEMNVRFAYRQRLLALLELDAQVPADVPRHPGDRVDIHQRAAMDPPERLRVQLLDELLDRPADEGFLLRRDDQRVLAVGLEVHDLLDRDQAQLVALGRGDP